MSAVVINANNIMGLSAIRSLGRKNVPITAIFGRGRSNKPYYTIVKSSKYISERHFFDENDYENGFIGILVETGMKSSQKPVLFPASDEDMILVSRYRDTLAEYYHISLPSHDILDTLLRKERFYAVAGEFGIPIPKTYVAKDMADAEEIADNIGYPCLLKPSWRDEKWLREFKQEKVFISNTKNDLVKNMEHALLHTENICIQEEIKTEENNIYCTFTFLNDSHDPLLMFVCRKLRQYPPQFGNTSLAESVYNDSVVQLTKDICRKLKLVGYVSIEYKKDADGFYKVLEITPSRLNKQAGLSDAVGLNIPYTWYRYARGEEVRNQEDYETGAKWVCEINEIRSFVRHLKEGHFNIISWLKAYNNIARYEIAAKDDRRPIMMLFPTWLANTVKRERRET